MIGKSALYSVFSILDNTWGPHQVDRFASPSNAWLGWFNSKFWYPGTEAVDASMGFDI